MFISPNADPSSSTCYFSETDKMTNCSQLVSVPSLTCYKLCKCLNKYECQVW